MSTNRPRPKPNIAPGDRAAQQADGGDEQRREVGRDAEDRDLRHRRELEDPADQAEQREAGDGGARSRSRRRGAVEARQVGGGLGQHLDDVEAAQVGGRLDVDRAVELALALDRA